MTYHREARQADPLRFTTQLLGHDAKRLHFMRAMYHAHEGYLIATNELMSLHVALDAARRPDGAGDPGPAVRDPGGP